VKETMSQNYQPGQFVRLARTGLSKWDASANDLYEVLRLMPLDQTGEVTYRIKSLMAGERAVRKADITPYVSPE
jgi:NAD(P)H-flavin reductase